MDETGESSRRLADGSIPCLPVDYQPPSPTRRSTRIGFVAFCLSVFSLTFMGTSFSMYRHLLGFNQREIQLLIAWVSIALGGISALLSPIALYYRRGVYEIAAVAGVFIYWLVFVLLLHA